MKLKNSIFLVFTILLVNCKSRNEEKSVDIGLMGIKESQAPEVPINSKKTGLQADLEKYDGFYSSNESTDGKITPENLPKELINYKKANIKSFNIEYLDRLNSGFILTYNIDYSGYNALVVSTLDQNYNLVDYRTYPNGQGFKDFKKDTISLLTYI
ncbi:hypothetical protein [Adhaeribacter soli]|uniref:Uncharacterized protein n=1 Tax=Adhaeribacter soli TaxID=2607655 RepID=A0A5N1J5B2_9BACT|nr:hypothetical protein [Adhaeribacter soli]KAA9345894.1 hypothetical protein F0P94_02085 [Adhaeribacter soli]